MSSNRIQFIGELENIIAARLDPQSNGGNETSYTASLANAGIKRVAQKVGEEAVELALAAVDGGRDEVLDEAADLVYHLLVLLKLKKLSLADVDATLRRRHADA